MPRCVFSELSKRKVTDAQQVVSYPSFQGLEMHYLRAQIARISAATVVSPAGYYIFDPEENDEDAENTMTIIVNPDYEGVANEALINLNSWVHHVPYILPQGRTTWVNPVRKENESNDDDDDASNDDDASRNDDANEPSPETGPSILTPLARDEDHNEMSAWSGHLSSRMTPTKYTPIYLRSTRWPGAVAIAYNEKFANIYVGDGLKDLAGKLYVDEPLPNVEQEYGSENGPGNRADITEERDASVEDEKAFEDMLRAEGHQKEDDDDDDGEDETDEEDG
jgi:radial spoke head protein 4A